MSECQIKVVQDKFCNTSKQICHNLWYCPVEVLDRKSAMSKDVDRVIQRSACLGAHPSNIEEELADSLFAFLSYENIMP